MLVGFVIYYEVSGKSQLEQPAQKIPFLTLFEVKSWFPVSDSNTVIFPLCEQHHEMNR